MSIFVILDYYKLMGSDNSEKLVAVIQESNENEAWKQFVVTFHRHKTVDWAKKNYIIIEAEKYQEIGFDL